VPIYEYACQCGALAEDLFRMNEAPDTIPCPRCAGDLVRLVSLPAHTPGRWGDNTGRYGVNGFYDRGLGATYHNTMEREKLCRDRGLIPLQDMGADWWDRRTEDQLAEKRKDERLAEKLQTTAKKYGGDMTRAISEVMPARDILAGKEV